MRKSSGDSNRRSYNLKEASVPNLTTFINYGKGMLERMNSRERVTAQAEEKPAPTETQMESEFVSLQKKI